MKSFSPFWILLAVSLTATYQCVTYGDDWPQFLGKDRDGVSSETGLIDAFPASGPNIRWRIPGGIGMSAIAVQAKYAVTTWNADGKQMLVAMDSKTGTIQWKTEMGSAYENSMGDGPRATPAIAKQRVFAYSGEGILISADLATGKLLWHKNVPQELSAEPSEYGMSSSPLVLQSSVIVHAGAADAAVVALSIEDGKLLWKCGTGHAGYSSPTLINVAGEPTVVSVTGTGVWGIDPGNGKLRWSYSYETDYGCNTASPVPIDGGVFLSAGENHGSVLLMVRKENGKYIVSERWSSLNTKSVMRNEWQTSIAIGDYLYGFDNVGAAGPVSHFSCIESKTGKPVWQKSRFGKGNLIYADKKFWLTTIDGDLIIARADPQGFQELGRAALVGKTRQTLSIANGNGYLRDDNEIVCIDLKK